MMNNNNVQNSNRKYNGNFNLGRLAGSFGKFYNTTSVGKNNTPAMFFELSTRDNLNNFHNIPLVAFGEEAVNLYKQASFKDFLEVQYSVGARTIVNKQGYKNTVPTLVVYKHRMLKKASAKPAKTSAKN